MCVCVCPNWVWHRTIEEEWVTSSHKRLGCPTSGNIKGNSKWVKKIPLNMPVKRLVEREWKRKAGRFGGPLILKQTQWCPLGVLQIQLNKSANTRTQTNTHKQIRTNIQSHNKLIETCKKNVSCRRPQDALSCQNSPTNEMPFHLLGHNPFR